VPATSKNQAIAARIAEHNPSKLYARNRGMLGMSRGELHKVASTSEAGLPARKGRGKRRSGFAKLRPE